MKIVINGNTSISDLKQEFSSLFPFLKIELFRKPHHINNGSPRSQLQGHKQTIEECRTVHKNGVITITPEMTVSQLEQHFGKKFGLFVQVFRRAGRTWLETTVTDGWTLEEQNKEGAAWSRP
jgi:hypothetical protein